MTLFNHFFFRRPPKKFKEYDVAILLGREKLREGIPLWLKAFEFASPRISNVWILLELRGCWPWSSQIAASAARLAASATLLPRQLLLFFVLVLLQLGWMPWTAWSDGDVAVRTHRLATWSGSLDPKFKDVQSFHINFWWCFTTGFTQGFFIGAGMSRGVDQGEEYEEWWTPYAGPSCIFSGDSLAEIAKHHSTWRGKESHPNLGFTWVLTWLYPQVQVHIFRCM